MKFSKTPQVFLPFVFALIVLVSDCATAISQNFDTKAKQAILIDAKSNTVLFSKNENEKIPPASLAKLMTMEVVFSRLKEGTLKLTDTFFVSENAWKNGGAAHGGSTMFAKLNSEIALEDLIRGVIIQSANDGCIIIAEGLAGNERTFANLMNARAREIGLKDSIFTNSNGLPDENQVVTVADLAKLAQHIISTYPEYYKYYSEPEFEWNGIKQPNRNPLLSMGINADGMKTGFTDASGYAIVGSATNEDQRLIAVLSGMSSMRERGEEARKILDWGFRAFERLNIFEADAIIGDVSIYGGDVSSVSVTGKDPIEIYLPVGSRDKMRARIAYDYPIMPPIKQGDKIATLKIWIGDKLTQEKPLFATQDVGKGTLTRRATDALKELLTSWIPS